MSKLPALFSLAAFCAQGQLASFKRIAFLEDARANYQGGALVGPETGKKPQLYAWGDGFRLLRLPKGKARSSVRGVQYGAGGCLMDVNQDGVEDLIVHRRADRAGELGRMVWLEAPEWQESVIDTDSEFSDCLATTLFGKSGVLVVHRESQIRFYEAPSKKEGRWPYREIYSIYTPSAQGGLLRADVDGNGHGDILCGNYWLQSPEMPEGPWKLFAIHNWWEKEQSAMVGLAQARTLETPFPVLFAAQRAESPARVAWFERPRDLQQMWNETRLEAIPPIRRIGALAVADLNGDLRPDLALAENDGDGSRLLIYWAIGGSRYQGTRIDLTPGLMGLWATDYDGDGDLDLFGLGRQTYMAWKNQRLK